MKKTKCCNFARMKACTEAALPVIMTRAFNAARNYVMAAFRETKKKLSIQFEDLGFGYLYGGCWKMLIGKMLRGVPGVLQVLRQKTSNFSSLLHILHQKNCKLTTGCLPQIHHHNHDCMSLCDGRIPYPPQSMGGCGNGNLKLIHAKDPDNVSELMDSAQELLEKHKPDEDMRDLPKEYGAYVQPLSVVFHYPNNVVHIYAAGKE